MKKGHLLVLLIIFFLIPINIKAISFNASISGEKKVEVDKQIQLKMEYWVGNDMCGTPDCSDIGEVSREDITEISTWSSSDTEIATVDEKGIVTGKKTGKVTITAVGKPASESNTSLERSASYEIEVIESSSEITPAPSDNPIEERPSQDKEKQDISSPSTKVTQNLSVPNTKATIPLYISTIGSVLILLSVAGYIFVYEKLKEKK